MSVQAAQNRVQEAKNEVDLAISRLWKAETLSETNTATYVLKQAEAKLEAAQRLLEAARKAEEAMKRSALTSNTGLAIADRVLGPEALQSVRYGLNALQAAEIGTLGSAYNGALDLTLSAVEEATRYANETFEPVNQYGGPLFPSYTPPMASSEQTKTPHSWTPVQLPSKTAIRESRIIPPNPYDASSSAPAPTYSGNGPHTGTGEAAVAR